MRDVSRLVRLPGCRAAHAHLEMNVIGPPHVKPRKHCAEIYAAVRRADLDAAQKSIFVGRMVFKGPSAVRRRSLSRFTRGRTTARWASLTARSSRPAKSSRALLRKSRINSQRIAVPQIDRHAR